MNAFYKNLIIRALATAAVFGLPTLVAVWSSGSFGTSGDYLAAAAFALGGIGSAVISLATRMVGDPNSGNFTG
jgi:hypothetical protein